MGALLPRPGDSSELAVFLGDSITEAMPEFVPCSVNLGVSGWGIDDVTEAAKLHSAAIRNARAVFLMVGINDLRRRESRGLEERYRTLLSNIPSKTPLIWTGLMPTDYGSIKASDIEAANSVIQKLCSGRGECAYIDPEFLAPNGKLNAGFYIHDRLHLNRNGYQAWRPALRDAATRFDVLECADHS